MACPSSLCAFLLHSEDSSPESYQRPLQRNIKAQRLREQALPVIETVGERIIEPGIEHELLAAERAAFLFQFVQKLLAIAAAALGLIGNEIVDIEEFAVDQVLGE
ncbi:MAG: hypothetical protein WBD83_02150 [Xanthobacteraceae bacterium]